MCDFDKGFILCTCNDKEPRHSKKDGVEYTWTLYKFIGENKESEIGRYFAPGSDIGSGLTSEFVMSRLNSGNCFDFDYTPNEGDNLLMHDSKFLLGRLEFIFKNGKWTEDHYSPFQYETQRIFEGKLKETDKK